MQSSAFGSKASAGDDKRRYLALDTFRGLAAVGVAIFHFRWTHPELSASPMFDRLFNLLDFFFILSGFVLAHVYISKPTPVVEFAWRRLARLYPLHVFALAMFAVLQVAKLVAEHTGLAMRQHAFDGMNTGAACDPKRKRTRPGKEVGNALGFAEMIQNQG